MTYNTPTKPLPNTAAYCIAKALHHAKAAAFYFDMCITEASATMGAKKFLRDRQNQAEKIVSDTLLVMKTDTMRDEIRKELSDPLALDAYNDLYISLTPENREKAETFLVELLNSQK